jgi:hypothetical protein
LSEEPNYDIILAIIALVSSIISAAATAFFTRKNEIKLKHLENELDIKKAEQDARRDYEYEAKKRLYQECEPILFQFAELSDSALRRIYALARNAREGNLGPARYWLSTDHYFMRSTIYRLFAPMASFRLLQRKLTGIDLKLDQSINTQYSLAKILYFTFTSAPNMAGSEPSIPYDPDQIGPDSMGQTESEKKEKRIRNPERYWLQGLKVGKLDNISESLIVTKDGLDIRIKSFGEFEQEFFSREGESNSDSVGTGYNGNMFEVLFTLFSHFHPIKRPVLWRVLVTQAYLYKSILNIRSIRDIDSINFLDLRNFSELRNLINIENIKLECDWRQQRDVISDRDFDLAFTAAENYLKGQLNST